MHIRTDINKNIQYHECSGSMFENGLVTEINAAKITENSDQLEVNLANHIEAFCDCV